MLLVYLCIGLMIIKNQKFYKLKFLCFIYWNNNNINIGKLGSIYINGFML